MNPEQSNPVSGLVPPHWYGNPITEYAAASTAATFALGAGGGGIVPAASLAASVRGRLGRGLRRERLVVLAIERLVQVARLVDPLLDRVLLRLELVDHALALRDDDLELFGGPPRLLSCELGLDRQVGICLRHAPDELEPVREVGERGRVEQHRELRSDVAVREGRAGVQARGGVLGRRARPIGLRLHVAEALLHGLQAQVRLVVLLDE